MTDRGLTDSASTGSIAHLLRPRMRDHEILTLVNKRDFVTHGDWLILSEHEAANTCMPLAFMILNALRRDPAGPALAARWLSTSLGIFGRKPAMPAPPGSDRAIALQNLRLLPIYLPKDSEGADGSTDDTYSNPAADPADDAADDAGDDLPHGPMQPPEMLRTILPLVGDLAPGFPPELIVALRSYMTVVPPDDHWARLYCLTVLWLIGNRPQSDAVEMAGYIRALMKQGHSDSVIVTMRSTMETCPDIATCISEADVCNMLELGPGFQPRRPEEIEEHPFSGATPSDRWSALKLWARHGFAQSVGGPPVLRVPETVLRRLARGIFHQIPLGTRTQELRANHRVLLRLLGPALLRSTVEQAVAECFASRRPRLMEVHDLLEALAAPLPSPYGALFGPDWVKGQQLQLLDTAPSWPTNSVAETLEKVCSGNPHCDMPVSERTMDFLTGSPEASIRMLMVLYGSNLTLVDEEEGLRILEAAERPCTAPETVAPGVVVETPESGERAYSSP